MLGILVLPPRDINTKVVPTQLSVTLYIATRAHNIIEPHPRRCNTLNKTSLGTLSYSCEKSINVKKVLIFYSS